MGEQSPDYDLHRQQARQAFEAGRVECAKEIARLLTALGRADLADGVLQYVKATT